MKCHVLSWGVMRPLAPSVSRILRNRKGGPEAASALLPAYHGFLHVKLSGEGFGAFASDVDAVGGYAGLAHGQPP